MSHQKINTFIEKVFNYYNGRINIFSKAKLFIEWVSKSSIAGSTRNPNIVTIYPLSCIKFSNNEYELYYILLESIIHELYHIDQIIDYPRMMNDIYYMASIECAVEEQTNIYLANHRQEIFENFGIDVAINSMLKINVEKFSVGKYYRKQLPEHIIGIVNEINSLSSNKLDMNKVSSKIYEIVNNGNKVILKFINMDNNMRAYADSSFNIDTFNDIVYNVYFMYQLPHPIELSINEKNTVYGTKDLIITIKYIPKMKMISMIKK